MIRPRTLAAFFGKVVAVYLLGVVAWNWLCFDRPYLYAFRTAHTKMFIAAHHLGSRWAVMLTPPAGTMGAFDTDLNVLNSASKKMGTQPLSAQYRGYAPTLLLFSLIAATPLPWTRRGFALLCGVLLLHAWIVFGICLLVLKAYVTPGELALYDWSDGARFFLNFVAEIIATSTATQFALPVLIWALVTFRTGDVEKLLGIVAESPDLPQSAALPPQPRAKGRRR